MSDAPHKGTEGRLARVWSDARAEGLARFVQRRHLLILLVAFVTAFAGFAVLTGLGPLKGIKINTKLISLLPQNIPSIVNLKKVVERKGGYGDHMFVVVSPDAEANERFVKDLYEIVVKEDWVHAAEYQRDTQFFDDHKLLYMKLEDLQEIHRRTKERYRYERNKNNPLHIDVDEEPPPELDFSDIEAKYEGKGRRRRFYRTDAGDIYILTAYPKGVTSNIGFGRKITKRGFELAASLKPESYHPKMEVFIGGGFKNRVDEYTSIINDVKSSGLWSLLAMCVLIILVFRRVMAVPYILLPLVMSLFWTFGLVRVVIGELNLITVFLFVILLGLGIDFGIHNLQRYDEERSRGRNQLDALTRMLAHTGRASITAALTTAIGFYVMMVAEFRGFTQFGFIAGTGILFAFTAMYVVFPAMLVAAERARLYKPRPLKEDGGSAGGRFPLAGVMLAFGILLAAGGVAGGFGIQFEWNFKKMRSNIPASKEVKRKIRRVFSLPRDGAIIYVDSLPDAERVKAKLEADMAVDETPSIRAVRNIYSVFPEQQSEKLKILKKLKRLAKKFEKRLKDDPEQLQKITDIKPFLEAGEVGVEDIPKTIRLKFKADGSEANNVFVYHAISLTNIKEVALLADDISTIELDDGKVYNASSEALINLDMMRMISRDAVICAALALLMLFLVLRFDLRDVKATLIVLTPMTVGILWMLLTTWLWEIRLNVFNMVVFTSVMGIGVDDGIHIFHRYEEEGPGSLLKVLRTTGVAALLTTLTSAMGFGGMVLASHDGLRTIGTLALIGLLCTLLAAVLVLPALLQVVEDRRQAT